MEDEKNVETSETQEEIEGFEGLDPEIVNRVIEENKDESEEIESETAEEPSEIEKLQGELNLYRNRFGDINQQPPQQVQPPPIPQQRITPEFSETIEKATIIGAKRLTGWDDDDIDALEYMDEDDPRRQQWETAKNIARNGVYDHIRNEQMRIGMAQQRYAMEQQAALREFNEYANREMRDPNFQKVQEYALGDYMSRQSASDQFTLATAYDRIVNNRADPRDLMVVKTYYERAKQSLGLQPSKTQFPRSSRVGGVAGNANRRLSDRELEAMIDRGEWDAIPQEYKDQMLNAYLPISR